MNSKKRARQQGKNLRVEILEDRRVLAADVIYLDFDATTGGLDPPNSQVDSYRSFFNSNAPAFLDVADSDGNFVRRPNGAIGDGTVDTGDARFLGKRIFNKVREIFSPYDVEVRFTFDGWGELQRSVPNDEENTYVMFIGDQSSRNDGLLGVTSQAPEDYNNEWYGFTFSESIAELMDTASYRNRVLAGNRNPTASDFIWNVAVTTAHEIGHMLGLGHPFKFKDGVLPSSDYDGSSIDGDPSDIIKLRHSGAGATNSDPLNSIMASGFKRRTATFVDFDASLKSYDDYDQIYIEQFVKNANGSFTKVPRSGQNQDIEVTLSFLDFDQTEYNARNGGFLSHDEDHDSTFEGPDFLFESTVFEIGPATQGTIGSRSIADVATELEVSYSEFLQSYLDKLLSDLNLGNDATPLLDSNFADILGLDVLVRQDLGSLSTSSSNTMQELRDAILASGFQIDAFLTDDEFLSMPKDEAADFIRFSKTVTLAEINENVSIDWADLGGIDVLAGLGLSGDGELDGNLAVKLGFGFDTAGFYILPGRIVEGDFLAEADVSVAVDGLVNVAAVPSISVKGDVLLNTSASDGRIRLGELGTTATTSLDFFGDAYLDLMASVDVAGNAISFPGLWSWDISPNGFILNGSQSGFDSSWLLDSLTELLDTTTSALDNGAEELSEVLDSIPYVGHSLAGTFRPLLDSQLDFSNPEFQIEKYLEERGMEIVSIVSPADIFDGSYLAKPLIEISYSDATSKLSNLSASAGSDFEFMSSGLGVDFEFSGSVSGSGNIGLDLRIGLDTTGGAFIREGSQFVSSVALSGELAGQLEVGTLKALDVVGKTAFNVGVGFEFVDTDAEKGEPIYFTEFDLSSSLPGEIVTTGKFEMPLIQVSVGDSKAVFGDNILGRVLDDQLKWKASASYDLTTSRGSYTLDNNSLPSLAGLKESFFQELIPLVDQYNPIPQSLRDFLTTDLLFLGNQSLLEFYDLGAAEFLVNPAKYLGGNSDSVAGDGGAIVLNYDLVSVENVSALLGGRSDVDIISLEFNELDFQFDIPAIPITPPVLLFSFLGVLNAEGQILFAPGGGIEIDAKVGVDSSGFYLANRGRDIFVPNLAAGIEFEITGSVVTKELFTLVEASVTPELRAEAGIGLTANAPAKIRPNELDDYIDIDLRVLLDIVVNASLGDGVVIQKQPLIEDESLGELVLYEIDVYSGNNTGSGEHGSDAFSGIRKQLTDALSDEACSAIVGQAIGNPFFKPANDAICDAIQNPSDIVNIATELGKQAIEFGKEKIEQAVNVIENITDEAGKVFQQIVEDLTDFRDHIIDEIKNIPVIGDIYNYVDQTILQPSQGVIDSVKKAFDDALSGFSCAVDGESWEYENKFQQQFTFDATFDNSTGVLKVTPNARGSSDKLNLTISVIGDRLYIDGADFVSNTLIGTNKHYRFRNFNCERDKGGDRNEYRDVTHSNSRMISGIGSIARIEIEGTEFGDNVVIAEGVGTDTEPMEFTTSVVFRGLDGNDFFAGGSGNDFFAGGDGADTAFGGRGDDELLGGKGNDKLFGGLGSDITRGGDGDDYISEEVEGNPIRSETNLIYGEDGEDTLIGSSSTDWIFGGLEGDEIFGRGGSDYLFGDEGDDYLDGGDGDDTISGGIGEDYILGGAGMDSIDGGSHGDTIYGDSDTEHSVGNADSIEGGDGDDLIFGGPGSDLISGGKGSDRIIGGNGNDSLFGGTSAQPELEGDLSDVLIGEAGNDVIHGGKGDDVLDGGEDDDTLIGGTGNDRLSGVSGADTLRGGSGHDTLIAGSGSPNQRSYLFGEEGDDSLVGTPHDDLADGGNGSDTFIADGDVDFVLADNSLTGAGRDQLVSIEVAELTGGPSANVFYIDKWSGRTRLDALGGEDAYRIVVRGDGLGRHEISDTGEDGTVFVEGTALVDEFIAEVPRQDLRNGQVPNVIIGLSTIRIGSESVVFSGLDVATIESRAGNDEVRFLSSLGIPVKVFGEEDDDRIILFDSAIVEFDGGAGYDSADLQNLNGQIAKVTSIGPIDGFNLASAGGIFFNVQEFIGSANDNDSLTGLDAMSQWTVNSDDSIYTYESLARILDFVNIETLDGGGKVDRFNMFATSFEMTLNGNGGSDLFNFLGGDLDGFAKANITGGSDDGGDAKTRDRVIVDDHSGNTDEPFDYRLEPHSLTNSVDDASNSDPADTNPPAPPRSFGGIFFDMDVEYLELEGTDGANRFSVRPSPYTVFHVDGNDPTAEDCARGGGDFLQLDLKPVGADPTDVTNPMLMFTKIDDKGRQVEGVWFFDPPHKDVEFENIERFNLLDKVLVSDDAGEDSVPEIDVVSATTLTSYSSLVKNFSPDPIVAFNVYDFGQAEPSNFTYLAGMRYVAANVNNDDRVDSDDVLIVIESLGLRHGTFDVRADVNFDGKVNKMDLLAVLERQGKEILERPVVGGVRTVVADLNCDGIDDIIAVSGANHVPTIQAFNGVTGQPMTAPQQLGDPSNQFGVYVAAGDFDGDGHVELTTSMERESERVTVWEFVDDHFEFSHDFSSGFGNDASSGVRVSSGDIDGDFIDEIIVSPGTGRDPEVRVFDGLGLQLQQISVSSDYGRGGLSTLAADLNGDGMDEILVLAGRRGGSLVSFVPGTDPVAIQVPATLLDALVTSADNLSPLSGVGRDMDGDGDDEFFFGQLSDGRSGKVQVFDWDEAVQELFFKDEFETDSNWTGDFLG